MSHINIQFSSSYLFFRSKVTSRNEIKWKQIKKIRMIKKKKKEKKGDGEGKDKRGFSLAVRPSVS